MQPQSTGKKEHAPLDSNAAPPRKKATSTNNNASKQRWLTCFFWYHQGKCSKSDEECV